METQLIDKLIQLNIDNPLFPYKEYHGQQALIFGCSYKKKNNFILKVIGYENEQTIQKELDIYYRLKQEFKDNENLVDIIEIHQFKDLKKVCILMNECNTNLKFYKNQLTDLKSRLIFFMQFLQGYKSLYNHQVIHRDIKPENILICFKDNKPIYQLTDFGVSKLCEESINIQSQIGTQQYAAPELSKIQSPGLLKFDYEKGSKIDVYSIGLVLYELQFGKLPFEKPKAQNLFFDTTLKTRLKSQVDIKYDEGWFVDLIMQMIQTNPDERVGFKKLYECYDKKLDKFILNLKKLTEDNMIQFLQSSQFNIINQKQRENQRRNNSRSPIRFFNNNQNGQQNQYHLNQPQFFNQGIRQQQCQTDRAYKR
ncbi:unnamed protein product [Paramecium octaurelia]|uniref:Protein kinase domain-containing protein n=1 Tax=Paramecium octaurelia TaxID=43137 RepID=A0A8S1WT83_PAROT|nr:unnamed protein product [Paramecium octaurelia]